MIALVSADRAFAFIALCGSAVAFRIFPINADASALPGAGDLDPPVAGRAAFDALTTGAHHREQRFDAMDAIPEQVGVRLFERAWTPCFRAEDFADGTVAHGLRVPAVAERRGTEHRHAGFLCGAEDFDHVLQRAGHWFVDVERFAGSDHRLGLFEVRPSVHALQHDGVHVLAQLPDAVVDRNAILVAQFFGVTLDTRPTRLDVRAPARERGDDLRAGDVVGVAGIVQQGGEGRDVRRVETDHADA